MHILHIASGREWRGGQRQAMLLAHGLAAHHDLTTAVVTGRGSPLAARLPRAGVITHSAAWSIGVDPRVLPIIWRACRHDTMLHAHDSHAFALADIVARARRLPLVVTKRTMHHLNH